MTKHDPCKNTERKTNRKTTVHFYIAVEGACEEMYFQHLKKLINDSDEATQKVSFSVKKETRPKALIKRINFENYQMVFFVWDKEGEDEVANIKFKSQLTEISRIPKKNNATPAFSHLSFELWLILHKRKFLQSVANVSNYLDIINKCYELDFTGTRHYKEPKNFQRVLDKITLDDVKQAIVHGTQIRECNKRDKKDCINVNNLIGYNPNPDLLVHEMIIMIFEMCGIDLSPHNDSNTSPQSAPE